MYCFWKKTTHFVDTKTISANFEYLTGVVKQSLLLTLLYILYMFPKDFDNSKPKIKISQKPVLLILNKKNSPAENMELSTVAYFWENISPVVVFLILWKIRIRGKTKAIKNRNTVKIYVRMQVRCS